jgi:parallel beta-helix repeat protein
MKKCVSLLVICLMLSLCFSGFFASSKKIQTNSSENILYVGGTGSKNYTTIQDAIDNAINGDTVYVYTGTYYEHNIIVDKKINLIGEDKNSTIIDVQGNYKGIQIYADEVVFTGFTLKNNTYKFDYWYNSLLEINKTSNVIINDNIFINSHNTEKPINICGMCILESTNCTLRYNQFFDCNLLIYYLDYLDGFKSNLSYYIHDIDTSNTANGKPIVYIKNKKHVDVLKNAGQVILVNCSYCKISNLVINNVTDTIHLFYSDYNIVENNKINGSLQGFWTEYANYNIFRNNTFTNTSCSMWLSFSDYNYFTNNTFTMITIEQESRYNIFTSNIFHSSIFHPNAEKKAFSIQLDDSDWNVFSKNNIYSSGIETVKVWGKCRHTVWDSNYWNKWIGLNHKLLKIFPKIIICWQRSLYDSYLHSPKKINFPSYLLLDKNPVEKPYNINCWV